ncbi:hypothetical protein [Sphingomonas sp. Leaf339]|nr:hypothetical protein [Sphingomonas sp. Leaf339]
MTTTIMRAAALALTFGTAGQAQTPTTRPVTITVNASRSTGTLPPI